MPPEPNQPGHHTVMDVQAPTVQPAPAQDPQLTPHNLPNLPAQMTAAKPKAKSPIPMLAIIIATVVCVTLIGLVAVVYIRGRHTTSSTATQNTNSQTPTSGRLTGQDVSAAKQEITKNLNNMDDSKDFTSDDLSNQTLGL